MSRDVSQFSRVRVPCLPARGACLPDWPGLVSTALAKSFLMNKATHIVGPIKLSTKRIVTQRPEDFCPVSAAFFCLNPITTYVQYGLSMTSSEICTGLSFC